MKQGQGTALALLHLAAGAQSDHHFYMRLLVLLLLLLAGPAFAQGRPDARKAELEQLFAALKMAPNEEAAAALEGKIRNTWQQAGSPAVVLLLNQGAHDLELGDTDGALDSLDDALVLEPDYAEAWLRRALTKFHVGDYSGAIRDIQATLQREPRHFVALQTLSPHCRGTGGLERRAGGLG